MEYRSFDYDVAFSYAGEDRQYVDQVAELLKIQGVRVFYDQFETSKIWGRSLFEYLYDIYRNKARYCVIFISRYYKNKVWPTHELRSAIERALEESGPYILPARFDDTELPGITTGSSYIDLRQYSPNEFATLIMEKLNFTNRESEPRNHKPAHRVPRITPSSFNKYDEAIQFVKFLQEEIKTRSRLLQNVNASISIFEKEGKTCFRVVCNGITVYSLNVWLGGMLSDSGLSFYGIPGEIRVGQNSLNAWGEMTWNKEKQEVLLELHDVSLLQVASSKEKMLSFREFVDKIWELIVDQIEKRSV